MNKLAILTFMVLASGIFTSCLKDECVEKLEYAVYEPVYLSEEQYNEGISVLEPRPLQQPGIIYTYQDYLFINELNKGIHIFDNSDPNNPQAVSFISILGNTHFAIIKNQILANKFGHLLSIDISNPLSPEETSRVSDVSNDYYFENNRGYLAYYEKTDRVETIDCSDPEFNSVRWTDRQTGNIFWQGRPEVDFLAADASNSSGGGDPGVGGSTARMTISHNTLYWVNDSQLLTFDISDQKKPREISSTNIGWGIETIYPFKDKLFIGSTSGMFIFSLEDPYRPELQSSFSHANACDPVVANDNTAFVTLRSGNECNGFVNQLDVIDVENINAPYLIRTYEMIQPQGISLLDKYLYLCEGDFGLKILDVSQRDDVKLLNHIKSIKANDVIALGNDILMVIGDDGFTQFDISERDNPKLLSEITVDKP
ncbi:LVIVD repeat-containing protein [Membranihabitans marinus]|uniref:LVIVD repeat-containing protein n=1 Tax=Membranihabitans marinus TaxID=1227546 RepID=UPI001F2D249C|nr:hypothetical protein [Membranihabitans marinus]